MVWETRDYGFPYGTLFYCSRSKGCTFVQEPQGSNSIYFCTPGGTSIAPASSTFQRVLKGNCWTSFKEQPETLAVKWFIQCFMRSQLPKDFLTLTAWKQVQSKEINSWGGLIPKRQNWKQQENCEKGTTGIKSTGKRTSEITVPLIHPLMQH